MGLMTEAFAGKEMFYSTVTVKLLRITVLASLNLSVKLFVMITEIWKSPRPTGVKDASYFIVLEL